MLGAPDIHLVHQINLTNTMIYLVELQFLESVCKEDGILDHWKVNRRCEKEGGTFQPPEPKYFQGIICTFQPPEHKYLGRIVKVLFLFL